MWPQTGNKSCSISLPCQSFKRVPGDVFVPPGRCLCCGGRAERWRSRAQRCWSCLIRGEKHPQQSSATECLWMRRLRSVSGACPWVSVEALTGVLGVELSSTCCCRAPEGAAGVSGGRAFQFLLVRDGVEPCAECVWSTAGGLLGANLISGGVCYRPRPLASQPVAKRKVFVFFCLFLFFSTFLLSAFTRTSLQSWDGDN